MFLCAVAMFLWKIDVFLLFIVFKSVQFKSWLCKTKKFLHCNMFTDSRLISSSSVHWRRKASADYLHCIIQYFALLYQFAVIHSCQAYLSILCTVFFGFFLLPAISLQVIHLFVCILYSLLAHVWKLSCMDFQLE